MVQSYRLKCPNCGEALDAPGNCLCSKCNTPLSPALPGMLHLYRMGSPYGIGAGFGIYIDDQPYGFIGNKQTVHIPLPLGPHRIHVASGLNRRCNDIVVNLTSAAPVGYMKVRIKPGFWTSSFELIPAAPSEIPNL